MKHTSYNSDLVTEISWALDNMGVLTISGNGRMPDYACGRNPAAPWKESSDAIKSLVVEDGITEIGINAFRDCRNLKNVKLSRTVHRIHAYAFRDCTSLKDVESARSGWKYIYDNKWQTADEDTVIFGIESFSNCPWAEEKWNNFYMHNGVLYVCFTGKNRIEIPEGVHTLHSFSMADIAAKEIICPSTLKRAEEFAFSGSVACKIWFPDQMEFIDPYAVADSRFRFLRLPKEFAPADMKGKKTWLSGDEKMLELKRAPELAGKYYLGTEKIKGSDRFRRLKIMKHKPVFHRDGRITVVWDNDYLDVGKSVLNKIKKGSGLICIEHEAGKVSCVKVMAIRYVDEYGEIDSHGIPCIYLMYPEKNGSNILLWKDSYTYFQEYEVWAGFRDGDVSALAESGNLRFLHPDTHEEWLWCTMNEDNWEWSGLALSALRLWLTEHPEMLVDTEEENIEKTAYRWFVSV